MRCTWALRSENLASLKGKNYPLLLKLRSSSLEISYKNIVRLLKMKLTRVSKASVKSTALKLKETPKVHRKPPLIQHQKY